MTVKRAETCSLHTINDVFDVYCFYLLVFKRLTNRDDFNQSKKITLHSVQTVYVFCVDL
jgi:hypothetical protein